MKKVFRNIGLTVILLATVSSCDSSSDAVTPLVVASTNEFLWIKTPNIGGPNDCGTWNLKKEITTGATFNPPTNLFTNDFASVSSTIPATTLLTKQCSAYDKMSKRYVVSSGERVVVFNFNTVSGVPLLENQFPVANIQAVEFAKGRFFAIKNNKLNEYDPISATPTIALTSFNEITLSSGQVSNLTQKGKYLSVIAGGNLYVIDITGSGTILTGFPQSLSTTDTYEGLEAINSSGSDFDLYVVKRNATSNEFQKIDLTPTLSFTSVNTKYTLGFTCDATTKISSALDYDTEFYYLSTTNPGPTVSNSITTIDLTPTNPAGYMPILIVGSANKYAFGFQLKD